MRSGSPVPTGRTWSRPEGGRAVRSCAVAGRTLRYIDPLRRRGVVYRLYAALVGTRLFGWVSRRVAWDLDPVLLSLTRGRLKMGMGLPTALLETRGARSGQRRRNGVIYFHDRERVIIVASKLGLPTHPAWFHNLRANPDVALGGQPFTAQVVEDEAERQRLWTLADQVFPPYATYRARAALTGRTIPIVQLTPR
jgi:deazaflavin-dependent oxidoreductase (nitroreductase family)